MREIRELSFFFQSGKNLSVMFQFLPKNADQCEQNLSGDITFRSIASKRPKQRVLQLQDRDLQSPTVIKKKMESSQTFRNCTRINIRRQN